MRTASHYIHHSGGTTDFKKMKTNLTLKRGGQIDPESPLGFCPHKTGFSLILLRKSGVSEGTRTLDLLGHNQAL